LHLVASGAPASQIIRHWVAFEGSDVPGPHKITLAQAKAQGDFMLMFYCERPAILLARG
jgi:hypothetical protein